MGLRCSLHYREKRLAVIHIVEDDPSVLRAAVRLLTAAGFAVRSFPSAQAFLAQPRNELPACVILGLPAPIGSSVSVLRGLRIPAIVISADPAPQARDECLDAGAAAYVPKPVDDRLLLNAISAALARPAMTR